MFFYYSVTSGKTSHVHKSDTFVIAHDKTHSVKPGSTNKTYIVGHQDSLHNKPSNNSTLAVNSTQAIASTPNKTHHQKLNIDQSAIPFDVSEGFSKSTAHQEEEEPKTPAHLTGKAFALQQVAAHGGTVVNLTDGSGTLNTRYVLD